MFNKILLRLKKYLVYPKKRYGCGSGIFYLKYEETFFDACKWHDIQYEKGYKNRLYVEIKFLGIMLKTTFLKFYYGFSKQDCPICAINMFILGIPVMIWDLCRAVFYFLVVLIVGGKFYKKGPLHFKGEEKEN